MSQYDAAIEYHGQELLRTGRRALALSQETGSDYQVFDDGHTRVIVCSSPLVNLDSELVSEVVAELEDLVDRVRQQGSDPVPALMDSLHLRAPKHVLDQLVEDLRSEQYETDPDDQE